MNSARPHLPSLGRVSQNSLRIRSPRVFVKQANNDFADPLNPSLHGEDPGKLYIQQTPIYNF